MTPAAIYLGRRVVHPRHGRGAIQRCYPDRLVCWMQPDDCHGVPALVQVRDLLPEPAHMPPSVPDLRLVAHTDDGAP